MPSQSQEASGSNSRKRPANSVRQHEEQRQSSTTNAARTDSLTPSMSNTPTSYASVASQPSKRAPSTAPSQSSSQPCVNDVPIAPSVQARGYQSITSVEPAPKRPLWSLGTTLPRVRRLPAKATKTAHPTPGSRSNIVQRPPPAMVPMQTIQQETPRRTEQSNEATGSSPELQPAPVYGHDYASNAESTAAQELHISPTTSASSSAAATDLPPIREGEPLPTSAIQEVAPEPPVMQARPRFDYSFSSPTVTDATNVRVVGDDKLGTAHRNDNVGTAADGQQRLSQARRELVEEANYGEGLLATQGSAVDADEHDDATEAKFSTKHIKTSSMPFLPSQGFEVLVPEPSHRGADQLKSEANDRKRSRAESQNRSAMDQTRHPGLSGARPAPRGRTAGGPAAGVGIRKPSTQSARRGSTATNEERGYFDEDPSGHELAHLDRTGSTRDRPASQHGRRSHEDHIEARPVGGRSSSQRSSDTRSAWLSKNMPSQVGGRDTAQNAEREEDTEGHEAKGEVGRNSDETAFSSAETHAAEGYEGNRSQGDNEQDGFETDQEELWLGGQGTLADGSIAFPTTWSRWRYHSREFLAELLATTLLLTVGTAVDCQVTLSQSMGPSAGSYPNQNWAWGLAVASTIYLSGGRSGAHCNPAITLALAVFRGFPWIQVPIYWTAQLLGSMLGAAITYGIYLPAINQYEGGPDIRTLSGDHGTGRLFVTVPQLVFTSASGFGTEVAATSILMAMVLAVGDETNAPPSDGLSALVLGFVVVMIGMSFGWPTSYAISPSRDLGPRLFLYMVGYGRELWTHNAYWWLYGPQAGCFAGALLGALLYDLAIFTGEESPVNYTQQGWRQSTPARVGSRLLNSAERARFLSRPFGRFKQGSTSGDGVGKKGAEVDGRAAALKLSRSENDAMQTQASSSEPDMRSRSNDSWKRRPSETTQQLDAQEQGRL